MQNFTELYGVKENDWQNKAETADKDRGESPQQSKWEGDYDFEFYRFRIFKHIPLQRLPEIARILGGMEVDCVPGRLNRLYSA